MDTGGGYDLVPRQVVKDANLCVAGVGDGGVVFHTANGRTDAVEVADVQVGELDEVVSPFIWEETPAVLSVGSRCVHLSYSFI